MEKLDKLVKSSYTLKEAESFLTRIHKDYDENFIQEEIASGELPAFLNLKNCYLFPVEELENSYNYLELCNDVIGSDDTHVSLALFVKDERFEKIHNETKYRVTVSPEDWPTSSDIQSGMIIQADLGVIQPYSTYYVINSCDLLNGAPPHKPKNLRNSRPARNGKQSIIEVTECGLPVTPVYWNTPRGITIIPKATIQKGVLSELNLSPKRNPRFQDALNESSVVKFQDDFYYVVNLKKYKFDGTEFNGYSLSNDIAKSFLNGEGVIIKKEDLIEYEKNCFSSQSDILISSTSSTVKIEPQEQTLQLILEIINDFTNAECYVKSGSKTQQGLIGDWLEPRVPKSTRKDDNGNKSPNRDYTRVLKQLISERYNITTIRSK